MTRRSHPERPQRSFQRRLRIRTVRATVLGASLAAGLALPLGVLLLGGEAAPTRLGPAPAGPAPRPLHRHHLDLTGREAETETQIRLQRRRAAALGQLPDAELRRRVQEDPDLLARLGALHVLWSRGLHEDAEQLARAQGEPALLAKLEALRRAR